MGAKVNASHSDVTYKIIGTAMAIHNDLGPGHREEVCQKAMVSRLPTAGLVVEEQVPTEIDLDSGGLLTYILDLLVEHEVIVEIKAVSHPRQTMT